MFVVWAGTVFGPRLWQLSARWRSLAGTIVRQCDRKYLEQYNGMRTLFVVNMIRNMLYIIPENTVFP